MKHFWVSIRKPPEDSVRNLWANSGRGETLYSFRRFLETISNYSILIKVIENYILKYLGNFKSCKLVFYKEKVIKTDNNKKD